MILSVMNGAKWAPVNLKDPKEPKWVQMSLNMVIRASMKSNEHMQTQMSLNAFKF